MGWADSSGVAKLRRGDEMKKQSTERSCEMPGCAEPAVKASAYCAAHAAEWEDQHAALDAVKAKAATR